MNSSRDDTVFFLSYIEEQTQLKRFGNENECNRYQQEKGIKGGEWGVKEGGRKRKRERKEINKKEGRRRIFWIYCQTSLCYTLRKEI